MSKPVLIPLINPNDPDAIVAALHVSEGQSVSQEDLLATLETTKSTAELRAEQSGYVAGLRLKEGQPAHAGDLLCFIAETPDWVPPIQPDVAVTRPDSQVGLPGDLRITQPALTLARQLGIDLALLPHDRLVTESAVRSLAQTSSQPEFPGLAGNFDPAAVVIYGGGGHGKALIDLLLTLGTYRIAGIIDDGIEPGVVIREVPVLGGGDVLPRLRSEGVRQALNAVGGIGNISIRIEVFRRLAEAGFVCPGVVHPTAYVEPSAALAPGSQVFAQSYVGSEAQVGYGCIVNTGAIVSHDCILGDYANISPGAILAGEVSIGGSVLIGMGATINLRVRVGAGARIGNGATIKEDVPAMGIVRAGTIWP